MGLDTSHDCWHGPYSSFHAFRQAIAKAAGIPVDDDGWDVPDEYDSDAYLYGRNGRETDALPGDVIWVLLAHSDCDGVIPPKHCEALADRLAALEMPDEHKEDLDNFIAGLRDAAENWQAVEFA